MDVPGFGEAMFEALRDAGIKRLQDVERLRSKKVPGVGEKRAAQLWSTYKDELARLEAEARAMDLAALDAVSGGKLGALVEKEAAEERQRQRELESTRIRLADIERRRSQL
jgi:5'-3' exonuclease